MQRSNASSLRAVIIACVLAIILLSGLYLMKRMEANKLSNNLKIAEVERRDTEEKLSTKLTDQLEKIESLSQEIGLLQSRLTKCEDLKAASSVDLEQAQQKTADCLANKATVDVQKTTLQEGVNKLREENVKLTDLVDTLEEEAKDAEKKEEQCEVENSECQGNLDKAETDLFQCKQSREQTSKQLQSLQTQLQDAQARQVREAAKQMSPNTPKMKENPVPVQVAPAKVTLQDDLPQGVQGEAEEVDIAEEVNELEADFKEALEELDDQANAGDKDDDQKIDEDLAAIGVEEDKGFIAELEADENNVV